MLEIQDFIDFSITNWYEKFANVTMRTIIIELPEQLLRKIQSEEIDDTQEEIPVEFADKFKNALNALSNRAFVRNNWHAPVDARMFSFGNSLEVATLDDVVTYFSSSAKIQEDFSNAKGVPFCMALRKWTSIHPAAEFRCIVVNSTLRGITPRDWPTYYEHFKEEGPRIIRELSEFYDDHVKIQFPRKNYVFDVVFQHPDRPSLIDFEALNAKTNLYAFAWNEIQPLLGKEANDEVPPVFRYLENDIGIMARADALNTFSKSH
ncbi:unnamed protein product [Phyllotreta striolata]|uniref:Cell division cycle protein 123 n=1 Tax=Phyllotreta striolata TaxID=444603 RepID=A0A9N9TK38_PHYSR|nr:unnamed protein product [Phyllotreta striolata]